MPDQVVVRCGLRAGLTVDRTLARTLAYELRHAKALAAATRALRTRPLSEQRLRDRLRDRGFPEKAERAALATLSDAGLVDDGRLAHGRARALGERGWGNAVIAFRLAGEGLPDADVHAALAELEPEAARARRVVAGHDDRKAWALLARRGFDPETIEAALGPLDETGVGELG
jgi:SOS response regulatory protein OraA/RecX